MTASKKRKSLLRWRNLLAVAALVLAAATAVSGALAFGLVETPAEETIQTSEPTEFDAIPTEESTVPSETNDDMLDIFPDNVHPHTQEMVDPDAPTETAETTEATIETTEYTYNENEVYG